jgi:hypothetical protein
MFNLINETYADLYGYVELTDKQIDVYIDQYFGLINPDYVCFAVDEADNLVAVGIGMPSLSRALQRTKGRLFPIGFFRLLLALKFHKHVDLLLVAVQQEYQARGLTALMINTLNRGCQKNGVRTVETNVELETNTQVQAMWKHYEARQHKRRRCYIKALN